MAITNFSDQVLHVAGEVEAKAEEIHAVLNGFRSARRAAAVSPDIATEIQAAEDDLRAVEVTLREAGERFDRLARAVAAGTTGAVPGAAPLHPPIALTEVTNLLQLDRYPKHKKALKEWQRKEADLFTSISRLEAHSNHVNNEIFNIIGWFGVFQGVVLTAVSQLSQTATDVPVCGKIWFPILLTGFGTVVTVIGISFKFRSLASLEIAIQAEKCVTAELQRMVLTLQRKGPQNFCFIKDTRDCFSINSPRSLLKDKIAVILPLIAFSVIFIVSYFAILCDTWTNRDWDKGINR